MQLSSVQATCRFRYVCTPTPHSAMHAMHAFAFTPVSIRTSFAGQYIRQDDRRVRVYRFEENSTAHSWLEFIGGAFYPFSVLLCARRHYTGHFKSVITKPQNVFVMKDIMSNGYRAGGYCKFFKTAEEVSDRLNFEDNESDVSHPSMFAFIPPVEQLDVLQNAISISTPLPPCLSLLHIRRCRRIWLVALRLLPVRQAGGARRGAARRGAARRGAARRGAEWRGVAPLSLIHTSRCRRQACFWSRLSPPPLPQL